MAKKFDEMIKDGELTAAARLLAIELYRGGKVGHTRKLLIECLAERVERFEQRGFWITEAEYLRVNRRNFNLTDACEYCININNATKNSPRKRYLFCPMCGRVRG